MGYSCRKLFNYLSLLLGDRLYYNIRLGYELIQGDGMLDVYSVYNSIDGEVNGFNGIGECTTFIRLKGCNLKCPYCDTQYANVGDGGIGKISPFDLVEKY